MDGNGTQDVYEAEEHSNITLTLSSPVFSSSSRMYMDLINKEPLRCIYRYDSTYQPEPYMDETLRGRFQCDLQQDEDGQIRCLLRDLKFSDAGRYQSFIRVDGRSTFTNLEVVVKAVREATQEESLNATQRERPGMYVAFGLFGLTLVRQYHCTKSLMEGHRGYPAVSMSTSPRVASLSPTDYMPCCKPRFSYVILKFKEREIFRWEHDHWISDIFF
ncbi:PREDICTED: uncharacterized protein LOC107090178 [Cyprinodon variegatus]|uniref:uncharacterized protein LOC107090178 n=1 Tax=Cyprinodon variegatus TaxID=28743 RepID=UPI000742CDBD|nr:PREDICTED: uncharacterized protein LOC107090178 [Cyprinodon variegatus]